MEELTVLDAAARTAWPQIPLSAEMFAAHVVDRIRGRSDIADAIRSLHAADLFLACACLHGIAPALAALERDHLSRVPGLVRRIDSSAAFADEVAQEMREMFLVPLQGGRARIAEYSGRGPLSNWVRVIAVRTALRLRREGRRGIDFSVAHRPGQLQFPGRADPELDYLKLRYRGEYEKAFEAALEELPDRDALLLKLHYLDGLGIDRIGALYGIHRSTVARWRSSIRRSLLASTREKLQHRLSLTESEFDSLFALVRSQLAVSLRSALQRPVVAKP